MLDLNFEAIYGGGGEIAAEDFKKECFLLNTPKQCNESEVGNDIFNDNIFDMQEYQNHHGNMACGNDLFQSMEENNPDFSYFQYSTSEESSIISYPDQSPDNGSFEKRFKAEPFHNAFSNLDELLDHGPSSFSTYQNYSNMPPIIVQQMPSNYNCTVSSSLESLFSYPFSTNPSSILNLPRDTIVYVPTPIRDLQSNILFNSAISHDFKHQMGQPLLQYSGQQSTICRPEPSKLMDSLTAMKVGINEPFHLRESSISKKQGSLEKTFCCSTCDVKFTRRDELRRHEKIHSGEKPLSCPYCDKCFIRSDHRKTHIRTHTGEKPYACDICQKRFARSDEKLRHIKTHYKDRPRRRRRKKCLDTQNPTEVEEGHPMEIKTNPMMAWEGSLCNYLEGNDTKNYITSINSIFNSESQYPSSLLEQLWNS